MKRLIIILPLIILMSCSDKPGMLDQPPKLAEDAPSFSLTTINDSIVADNNTYAKVLVKLVNSNGFDPDSSVTFTINDGTFLNNAKSYSTVFSSDSTAFAYIKNNREGSINVTALIAGKYTEQCTVRFTRAFPTSMSITTDSSTLQPLFTSATNVIASLSRYPGSPSPDQMILFEDSVVNHGSVGTFFNIAHSDDGGNVTAIYKLQDTSFHGFVYIKGTVQTDTGKVVGINRIVIQ